MKLLSTNNTTRSNVPKLAYQDIKNAILGAQYDLTLNFVGATRARTLNQQSRGKDYVPNVLSFPLDDTCGEIYIAPSVTAREATKFDMTPDIFIGYLFIHGCLHLKGYDHGSAMEQREQHFCKKFLTK